MSVKDGLLDTVLGYCRVKGREVDECDCEAHYYSSFDTISLREEYPSRPICIRENITSRIGKEAVTG